MTAPLGRLIVLMAFDEDDEGNLVPAFDAREVDSEDKAKREARILATKHAGVLAWSRTADPSVGDYGEPVVIFQFGKIPDME